MVVVAAGGVGAGDHRARDRGVGTDRSRAVLRPLRRHRGTQTRTSAQPLIAATNEPEAWLLISLSTVDGLGTVGCYRRSSSRSRAVTSLVTRLGGTGWSTGKCRDPLVAS